MFCVVLKNKFMILSNILAKNFPFYSKVFTTYLIFEGPEISQARPFQTFAEKKINQFCYFLCIFNLMILTIEMNCSWLSKFSHFPWVGRHIYWCTCTDSMWILKGNYIFWFQKPKNHARKLAVSKPSLIFTTIKNSCQITWPCIAIWDL